MKRFFLPILLLFCTVSLTAQNKKWTLKECIQYAIQNNISIQQSELNIENSKLGISDAKGNFLPNFNLSAGHNWNVGLSFDPTTNGPVNQTTQNTSLGARMDITLYDGLANIRQLHRANLQLLSRRYQLDDMKDNISLRIVNSFLQIVFNNENLKSLNNQYNLSIEEYKRAEELIKSGTIARGDILEIEARLAEQQQQIINSENAIETSKIALANLLLIKDYKTFEIASDNYGILLSTILDKDIDVIYRKAIETRNEIKVSEVNVKISEENLKLSKASLLPTLSGFYQYSTRATQNDRIVGSTLDPINPFNLIDFGNDINGHPIRSVFPNTNNTVAGPLPIFDQFSANDGQSFGLRLSVPIFNRFQNRNAIKRQKINLELAELDLEQTKLNLKDKVYQAFNDAKGAFRNYEASQKTLAARKEAYQYSQDRFQVGLLNSFDLNQSKTRYENAQNSLVRAKYDYIFKIKILEFYFGVPLNNL